MKHILIIAFIASSIVAQADSVVRQLPDNLPGSGFGGGVGFMAGAMAGPLGALAGAGVGWLLGGETQEVTGLSGDAYEVRRNDGSLVVIRSPNRRWSVGDQVRIVNGNRLAPALQLSALGYEPEH